MKFLEELNKRRLVLDGSTGALLQGRGLPAGMAPDVWMMNNQDVVLAAHREYTEAGADILLTNTFGASRWRLAEYQAEKMLYEINARAVELARKGANDLAFVAGDIGPSGETVYPTGSKSFAEVFDLFYEQASCLVKLGVDLIVVETMFDSLELRAALSAVRAASSHIPLLAFATFNTDGVTDTGATPENIVAIANGFRATAVGVNCSTGPEPMVDVVRKMAGIGVLPVAVQPNAGLPLIRNGQTVFPLTPQDMQPYIAKFVDAGAQIIGGCCGTTPDFIRLVKDAVRGTERAFVDSAKRGVLVSSLSRHQWIGGAHPFLPIGEKLNPSGRKKLSAALKSGDLSQLLADAEEQKLAGAQMMDLNVGVPLVDEPDLMKRAVVAVQNKYPQVPLMIDSANTSALASGASVYYGRPLLNSLNAEDEKLEEAIPVVKKAGAAVVALVTGVDVPVAAEDRLKNAQKIARLLFDVHGLREQDVIFDCLGLVVSAMQEGSKATLRTIELIKEYFPQSATVLGLSNVSFGLPNRPFVHSAFVACAVERGLDAAIMSVTDPLGVVLSGAAQMWGPKAGSIENFINKFSAKVEVGPAKPNSAAPGKETKSKRSPDPELVQRLSDLERKIFFGIVEGEKDSVAGWVKEYSEQHPDKAMDLFVFVMTPAIRRLGDLFAERVKFIPHLMAAAETMKAGVAILEPLLIKARAQSGEKKGAIIFATVKGDIHDIGKNICALMLRNFGYEVIDLGRNVDAETILSTAIEKEAVVIGLSALMTTTMMQMKVVIDAVKDRKLPFKVVIGGAVVTPEFAREIQADGYSTDVGTVVNEMERVIAIIKALE